MKTTVKRITALFLILLLTASLLASCSSGGEEPSVEGNDEVVEKDDAPPVFDHYKSGEVDLGLSENEVIYDIIEVDGMLRATIGVLDPNFDPLFPAEYFGFPYLTEHRWYSLDYVVDTAKSEKTVAYHDIAFPDDPTIDFVFGGEPLEDEYGKGVEYHFYRDGEIQDIVLLEPIMIELLDGMVGSLNYGAMAQIMIVDGTPFASIHYGEVNREEGLISRGKSEEQDILYVNDGFVNVRNYKLEFPEYAYRGLIGIKGVPYALL
ncbi:MAG: hypothetical protein IJB51_13425, partial [Clostridia bacterium]|nr:hypothetical protein [Clostridia bacterium]